MTVRNLFFWTVAVCACAGVSAAQVEAQCPGIVPATAIKPDRPVADWVTAVPGQMHLRGAGMTAGGPETKTYLVPDKTTKSVQTFMFATGEERWIFCDYGSVELFRKVGEGANSCTITTKTTKPAGMLSALVVCK